LFLTPYVQRLLLVNIIVFMLTQTMPQLEPSLGLSPGGVLTRPWTVLTYMFVHYDFTHILFNMLMLFFFGPRLEERLGSSMFLGLYLTCGVGGAMLSFALFSVSPFGLLMGASGAVYGIVLGFARYWPRAEIYVLGIIPVQARFLAMFMVISTVFLGFMGLVGPRDNIAHLCHLGGLITSWVFLRKWEASRRRAIHGASQPTGNRPQPKVDAATLQQWQAIALDALHEINRDEVRAILAKAKKSGLSSLTQEERAFLDRMAKTAAAAS